MYSLENDYMSPLSDNDAEWLAIRKREALEIDPETAEADWEYGAVLDRTASIRTWMGNLIKLVVYILLAARAAIFGFALTICRTK